MVKAFFEPENLNALAVVFAEAKRRLVERGVADDAALDMLAHRIITLAGQGMPPSMILREIEPRAATEGFFLPGDANAA